MHSMCIGSGKELVEVMERVSNLSTLYTGCVEKKLLNPQVIQSLHNFYTQQSTTKNNHLTDCKKDVSTVSTEPITTTTIKYKER